MCDAPIPKGQFAMERPAKSPAFLITVAWRGAYPTPEAYSMVYLDNIVRAVQAATGIPTSNNCVFNWLAWSALQTGWY